MKLAIADTKYIKGIGNLEELPTAQALEFFDLDTALRTRWASDAHFITYKTQGPRYRKAVAEQVVVTTQLLCFDCDNPGHERWRSEDEVLAWFAVATRLVPFYYAIYTTRSGGRIILKLDKPIDVREAHALHKLMSANLVSDGLNIDLDCSDWTRMFRLPFVVRDDVPSWDSPLIDLVIEPQAIYVPRLRPTFNSKTANPVSIRKTYSKPQPPAFVRDQIWD